MYPVKRPKSRAWIWVLSAVILLLAAAAVLVLGYNRTVLVVEPVGDDRITLDYGGEYVDPGARVKLVGTHFWRSGVQLNLPVRMEGAVDSAKVGSYRVEYSIPLLWWEAPALRSVRVVDRVPPTIQLVSNPDHVTVVGDAYQEEGFTAVDNYDGDLTDRVERREVDGVVYYTVTDSSGNRTEVARVICYEDTRPPQITLNGDMTLHLILGTPYKEPGCTVLDNADGDLTAQVRISGSVDHNTPGTYTITYCARDSRGNEAVVTRTVIVEPAVPPEEAVPEGKVIYLTFDDGPSIYTRQLLKILEKYGVKATFFVIGNNPEIMAEIVRGGHSIGIHTVSHNYRSIYSSEEAFLRELYQMQQRICDATGVTTTLMRFPGGSSNTVSRFNEGIMTTLTQCVQDRGFQYFDWNVDSNDAGGAKDSDTVFNNVINGVQRQRVSVVLQHDSQDFSVEAVERIILWGLENGYTFLPLQPNSPTCHHFVAN